MVEGFEVPLHRSLTEPIFLAGAPRTVAIVNGTLAAAVGIGLHLWAAGPCAVDLRAHRSPSGARRPTRSSSMSLHGTSNSPLFWMCDHDESCANIADPSRQLCRLSAVGGTGRARCRAQQGRLLPAHRAVSRTGSRQRDGERSSSPRAARLNNALKRLGSGWAVFVEAERRAASEYPALERFRMRFRGSSTKSAARMFEEAELALREPLLHHASASAAEPQAKAAREPVLYRERRTAHTVDWREHLTAFVNETDRFIVAAG